MTNNFDIKKISPQLDTFYTAFSCFVYYSSINKFNKNKKLPSNFWKLTEFIYLNTLLENWNTIFGFDCKNNYWKEITFEVPEYTERFYSSYSYNYTSWTEYRAYINELTHNFFLYPDPYHHVDQAYDLEGVESTLLFTHEWLHKLIYIEKKVTSSEGVDKWPIASKNHMDKLSEEIHGTLANQLC